MYLGLSTVYSLVSDELSYYILIQIAILDGFVKYYFPGTFTDYVYLLFTLTLKKTLIINFIIISIVFYYCHISLLLSLLFNASISSVMVIWSILVLNHIIVFLLKMADDFKAKVLPVLLVSFLAVANLFLISLKLSSCLMVGIFILAIFIFYKSLGHSLYVK